MYQPVKWWPGLVVLLPLWMIANWSTTASVEADLGARALAAVPAATLDAAAVSIAGRDATLAGTAFSTASQAAAVAAANAVPGVRLVNASVLPLAVAKTYGFAAKLDAGKLTLSGNVPDPETRARLLAAAKAAAPQASVVDAMSYAAGAPEKFDGMAGYALAQVGLLSSGTASVTDGAFAVNGTAATSAAASKVQADAGGALPAGLKLAEVKITDIEGLAKAAAAAAKEQADKVAAAAAKEQADKVAAAAAKEQADKMAAAAAKEQADKMAAAAAKEQADKAAMPAGEQRTAAVATPEIDISTCQTLFNEALGRDKIQFKSARADIEQVSLPLLETILQTVRRCPKARIEISGHTDSDGDPGANVELSKSRAEAVMAFLVKGGLDAARVKADGFGDARPVASNATAEGKAQNRRIEFIVTE